ncbi:acyl-CoA synthetase short-chain family member 3, mitochondrial-like, partial [Diadema antillarum]|uniref:acyl-CoA synthetase short-chain family member 3, mitochondrial-like n=1 Tax=Diadema antillarum TaxID=105358 RepID=UPI003A88C08E
MSVIRLSSKLRRFAALRGPLLHEKITSLWNPVKLAPALSLRLNFSSIPERPQPSSNSRYPQVFEESISRPEEFWAEQAEQVVWFKKWDSVLDFSNPPASQWFIGGEINMCYNAVDRHVDSGHGDQNAVIHDSPVTGSITHLTYRELQQEVSKFASCLVEQGVQYGDRVLIYMPMIPQAVIAMLACARIGATHVLVFGGFASKELSIRIDHTQPKVIVSASVGIEPGRTVDYKGLLDEAVSMSKNKPASCIIYNRPGFETQNFTAGRDHCWMDLMSRAKGHDCVPVNAMDPTYILHTSGTTGLPKGPVRPTGGYIVALYWTMKHLYGLEPGEVWWTASDLGWIVGHSYICYAPLLHRNPTIIYEGKPVGTPDAGSFFRVVNQHGVSAMFTSPTALRAIIKDDPSGEMAKKYSLDRLKYLFVAGEIFDRETLLWCRDVFNVPILDHWWQTGNSYICPFIKQIIPAALST